MSWNHSKPIVTVTESHSYELDESEIKRILMRDDVKDLPVVVVCVTGIERIGKSYLLDYLLKYLSSAPSIQQDGSWLDGNMEPLEKYSRYSCLDRSTWGIRMWQEPFIIQVSPDKKVAVLVMEMDLPHLLASYCNSMLRRESSTIFALSTLLSSVQIYKISNDFQDSDLQHLQIAVYGKQTQDQNSRALKVLESLFKEWQYLFYPPLDAVKEPKTLHDYMLKTTSFQQHATLRNGILSSTDKVCCYHMPDIGKRHPAFYPNFNDWYKIKLINLVETMFSQENLSSYIKRINNVGIKAKHLFLYFKSYTNLFNNVTLPKQTDIMEVSVEVKQRAAFEYACNIYEKGMETECGRNALIVSAPELKFFHRKYVDKTTNTFAYLQNISSEAEITNYFKIFSEELRHRLLHFADINIKKIQHAIDKARESYNMALMAGQNIGQNQLCVHSLDLEEVHTVAVAASLQTLNQYYRKTLNNEDEESAQFVKSLENSYVALTVTNEHNNMIMISNIIMDHWKKMRAATIVGLFKRCDFMRYYKNRMHVALNEFNINRSVPNQYAEDVFKNYLFEMIKKIRFQLEAIKHSVNSQAMQTAVDEYDKEMKASEQQCLNSILLERANQKGLCRALEVLRPGKAYLTGIDDNDKDEKVLMKILQQRYKRIQILNDLANKTNAEEAFCIYLRSMEDFCRSSQFLAQIDPLHDSLNRISEFHKKAKGSAIDLFKRKRNNGSNSNTVDPIKNKLIQRIEHVYKQQYFWPALNSHLVRTLQKKPSSHQLENNYTGWDH